MKRFHNQTAIITGGAQGIGKSICIDFAKEGANVVIVDIDIKKGKNLEKKLLSENFSAKFIYADVSKETSIKNMVKTTVSAYGTINILVNCAAKFIIKGLNASVKEWKEMFMTNVVGYVLCAKHCVPFMKKNKKGAIVNIASISGLIAQPEYLTYNTTKSALINMARCLALDLANFNIRVNNVCPGTVWTENNEYYTGLKYGVNREQANVHPEIGGMNMLKKLADPEDIAKAVLFLASDDASYITAENLVVDGGYIQQ